MSSPENAPGSSSTPEPVSLPARGRPVVVSDSTLSAGAHQAAPTILPTHVARRLPPLVRALRPLQWTKNAIVLAALVFDEHLFEPSLLLRALVAFVIFCGVSSGMYLLNDLRDIESDRLHPQKRLRPIASSLVSPTQARTASFLLLGVGLLGAWWLRPQFFGVVATYATLIGIYSLGLKRVAILDIFAIAAGFVLRAAGGAVAIDVPISPWLYVCTMLLALFIGFGKRRHELTSLTTVAVRHRPSLDAYSVEFLDQLLSIVAAATIVAYSFYTFGSAAVPTNHAMMLTIPFVVYAIFRYLYLIHRRDKGGSPETLLFSDLPLLAAIVIWGISCVVILYLTS